MRLRSAASLGVASFAIGAAALVACVDLFHSTSDVRTACEIDASAPGCIADAGVDAADAGPTDFCAWSHAQARANAAHACTWLGACETPLGGNAFGPCMVEATLAYDCAANPDHRVRGKTHALWDCLWQAKSCDEVDACVFPRGPQPCSAGGFTACGTASNDAGVDNFDVRIECVAGGTKTAGENCALWGRTCGALGSGAACMGDPQGQSCASPGCTAGHAAHWCADGGDVGIDCASNGAGKCGVFSGDAGQWSACAPEGDASAACAADLGASCDGGVSTSYSAGATERVDCSAVLGLPGACNAGPLSPPLDWTSACAVAPAECTGDECNGSQIKGCARGAPFVADCASQGLGGCNIVKTDVGHESRAACARP